MILSSLLRHFIFNFTLLCSVAQRWLVLVAALVHDQYMSPIGYYEICFAISFLGIATGIVMNAASVKHARTVLSFSLGLLVLVIIVFIIDVLLYSKNP